MLGSLSPSLLPVQVGVVTFQIVRTREIVHIVQSAVLSKNSCSADRHQDQDRQTAIQLLSQSVSQSAVLQEIRKLQSAERQSGRVEPSSGYLASPADICFNNSMIGNKQSNIGYGLYILCRDILFELFYSVKFTAQSQSEKKWEYFPQPQLGCFALFGGER